MYNVGLCPRRSMAMTGHPSCLLFANSQHMSSYPCSILFEDRVGQKAKAAIKIGASQTVKQIHARP